MVACLWRVLPLCFLAALPVRAEDAAEAPSPPSAGHSWHGEAFNEGPRQRAYLMDGTGRVTFPATTQNELAQKFINQGLGQLHGFWYFEAERSFRQAAALDPDCAIAYWGMAMANVNNAKRAEEFIAEAVKRKEGITGREALYIDALDAFYKADAKKDKDRRQKYVAALEQIVYRFPEDIEAKAFLGMHLWQNHGKGIPLASHLTVDALLRDVLAQNPAHPCHHYIIHLWDKERPENAVASAARCGPAAPGIAHMWHMPGHTYSKLKRYRDAVWQQEASARVDHAHMIRDRVLPDQIHNFAHNNEWLIRNLIFVGRMHDALDLAKNMIELPRHPKYNTLDERGSASFGRTRLLDVLSQYELWDELIALSGTMYLEPTDKDDEQIKRLRWLGRAHFAKGDVEQGQAQLAALEQRATQHKAAEDAAVAKAEQKARAEARKKLPPVNSGTGDGPVAAPHPEQLARRVDKQSGKEIEKARDAARRPFASQRRTLQAALDELQGHAALAAGDAKQGLELLKKADGIDRLLLARCQAEAGELEQAEKTVADHRKGHKNEVLPLAALIDIRWRRDKKDEARQAFEELRTLSNDIDLDAPAMVRLTPVAQELGYGEDWRVKTPFAADTGERPDLDTLGPFRWRPSPAAPWVLKDVHGEEHSLAHYRGRPVVVIFYLGYGCLHCAEQLQAFAPKAEQFANAGIELIAISTDAQPSLQRSLDAYNDGTFPFPLVSDADLDVFRAYRCYDDFEAMPLHGTFLIDAGGLVRWQDTSYEPFMDPAFVLKEAQRLLGTAPTTAIQTAKPAAE